MDEYALYIPGGRVPLLVMLRGCRQDTYFAEGNRMGWRRTHRSWFYPEQSRNIRRSST